MDAVVPPRKRRQSDLVELRRAKPKRASASLRCVAFSDLRTTKAQPKPPVTASDQPPDTDPPELETAA